MRYFKIVLACFGFILAVVGITAGVLFLTGKFDKEVIQPENIAFEITEKLTEDDFEVVVNTTTENVTEKDVTLSLTNQTEADGMISDGVITIPKAVKLGTPFTVKVNKTHYAGMTEEWNVGGTSIIRAKSTNPLIQEATPLTVEVDVPVHSLGVELVTTTGTKIGTVSARDLKNYMKTLAEGDEDKKVVELAVGSVVRLQPVFTPEKSAKTTKGEQRKVLFEIPTAWKGIHIDFVDGENDLIEILRQTTVEDIKINAYCFRTSADEYEAQSQGYSNEELISMMSSNGISGESAQIFGTNQKITSFTSSTNDEYINLAINTPQTLIANGTGDNAFNLGLGLASDAGVAKIEDKIAVIKLFAYWQNEDEWEDAGDKLIIIGQTSSSKTNGVKAKINKNDANLSSWRVIASETGTYKIVAKLSYEYYSSSSSVPTTINFEIPFNNILVSDPISSDVAWKSTLPAIKTLVVLDGETAADIYYPTINLSDFVDIKNANATYKVVRFFAYSTEKKNLSDIIDCSLYSGKFSVPDSSAQYEVFEIPNGILTAKDVGSFRIFFATVVSDYMGNPKIQSDGGYVFESFSNTNTINVVKSLKQLDASMTVNEQEDGKDYNKNTDENTRDHVFHVRQQDEKVFTLSLFVNDIDIFARDYADGKISIDFLLDGQKSDILSLVGDYTIDEDKKRIDFQVSVNSLPNNDQPTLECKITYDLDHRLDKFVSNNGNKVQIKVLNGFAQEIVFDAVKAANPRNSAENPIEVEIKFNAGSDNVATSIEYGITLNGQNLILADLSKVTINEEALNKSYTLTSSKPAVIAVEDGEDGPKLSILGSTDDEEVVVTATAADGSGLSTNLYFLVKKSQQIQVTDKAGKAVNEITIDGYQGNQINFRSYFDAKAGDIDLNNLLKYDVPIENGDKFAFSNDTLKIVSTLGRDASLQLYITSDFGFTKIVSIRIVSNISASSTYAFNDQGLDDEDFVARGETPPTERGTRVYAENSRAIAFVLTQEKPTQTDIAVSVDDFETNGSVQSISYNNGILTVCFGAVSQMTERTIIFKKNFSIDDEYAFVYTMKFLVFPNIKASLATNVGTEENPASYVSGETVVYDAMDNSNGLIKLERIMGASTISENATLEAKINGEWTALSSTSGKKFTLPASFRAVEGSFVEIRITYEGCVLTPIRLFFKPFFNESILLDAKVLYDGKLYVPFIADGNSSIALNQAEGVVYTIINATSEQYLRISGYQIEKLDRLYTKIITSEKLRIENGNGVTELPILILPIKYPFVIYDSIENAGDTETYRTVDLKQVIESDSIYDTLEASSEEEIFLTSKILVDGLQTGGALISIVNADGSTNAYVNFDAQNFTISANSVGKDQMIYVKVKCGSEFEEAFEFVYRIKITANQQIKVFYPYIEYNEEYNVDNAYEYQYFGSKNQVSVDLMEEFDASKTPNKNLLEELFPTTNGKTFARRFVVVREKDGTLIPLDYKDLHFEIASVAIGGSVLSAKDASLYAVINEKTTTDGVLQSATLLINRGQSIGRMDVTIRAYTLSGAEALYRFRVSDNPVSYVTYYKNKEITSDNFSVAENGAVDLNSAILVKTGENPQQPVPQGTYYFHMIINEKQGTDYGQVIKLSGGRIQISALVNDVETTIVIFNDMGEISRFNLILKCTIDHEVKSSTIGQNGVYDIGESIDFFNTSSSEESYSMQEISTRVYVRNYLNGTDVGATQTNNLFVDVGGYSIKDISKNYKQYVLLDNLKVYAENLFDTWGGKFYLGDEAKYEVRTDNGSYIYYNGSYIAVEKDDEVEFVNIPLQSTTDKKFVKYHVETGNDGNQYVIIPHLKFSKGSDTRDYVLYDEVVYENNLTKTSIEPYGAELENVASRTTYVNAYVNEYIRYKVEKDEKGNLKVSILRVTHNGVQYNALVNSEQNDNEYIVVDGKKHYFTRFYTTSFDGLAENTTDENGKDVLNVPKVRYMLKKDVKEIDLRNIIFYTQDGKSNNVLKLGNSIYIDGMFQFFQIDENGNENQLFVSESQEGTENKWTISINDFSPIDIIIKDITGKYVVGRLTIVPTVETSTDETENNKTIFIEAGDTSKVDYKISAENVELNSYASAMSKDGETSFTGVIDDDHSGWKSYVYGVESNFELSIDSNGQISGLLGKTPWDSITVEAKLQYRNNSATLTTILSFETWKDAILGEYSSYVKTYEELKTLFGGDYRIATSSGSVNDTTGDIYNVAYGKTITISLEAKCSTCGEWAVVGKEHKHWLEDGSEQISDLNIFGDDQKTALSRGGKVEIVDENDPTKKYAYALTADSTLEYVTSEDEITGIETGTWTLTGAITKTTCTEEAVIFEFKKSIQNPTIGEDIEVVITDGEKTVTTDRLDLSIDYTTLAKALFDEEATTILGYESWDALLDDCEVEFVGYDEDSKTFGGQIAINIILTTRQAKHTGTFHVVNQEYGNKTIHGVGNLQKIDGSLNDYTATGEITSVVYVGTVTEETGDIWVLPLATTKELKMEAILEQLEEGKGTLFDLVEHWWGVASDDGRKIMKEGEDGLQEIGGNIMLSTAASLAEAEDPFNTLFVYQNDYAIGNIHIYLEDYSGDETTNNWKICSSTQEGFSREIISTDGSKLTFFVADNLLTTTLAKTVDGKEEVEYITQNAVMNGNKYLFDNGLLLEWDGTNVILKMINKTGEIKFSFGGIDFVVTPYAESEDVYAGNESGKNNYFEKLTDLVKQPEDSEKKQGSKTYKAEQTGDEQTNDMSVVYKDKVEGNNFNFENWEYSATYEDESGKIYQLVVNNGEITITENNNQIKITINNITDSKGNLIEGGYTFVVDLTEQSAVTIIGGGETIPSPDTPIDGGVITGGQTKTIDLTQEVFEIAGESTRTIKIDYDGDQNEGYDFENDDEELTDLLFKNGYLQYLIGTLGDYKSNQFKVTKTDDGNIVSIIFTTSSGEKEYQIDHDDSNYYLTDKDGNSPEGTFTISRNTDLYSISGTIKKDTENESKRVAEIKIGLVFTYAYQVLDSISLVNINSNDFNTSGKLTVTGGQITSESVVKFRFAVLRGKGVDAKEVAFAYYSLSLKPSVEAVVTYPTISTSDGEIPQETEYFYAGAGEFDIGAKADISTGDENARILVQQYAYGTYNGEKTRVSYVESGTGSDRIVTLWLNGEKYNVVVNNNIAKPTQDTEFYIPDLTISYVASSNQNIIKGNSSNFTNKVTSTTGKFEFDMSSVNVSEAEVVISAQATVGETYTYTFAQYTLTVCKDPVISSLITAEDGHIDGNGAEILPINGGNNIKPFDTTDGGKVSIGGTTVPRLQFVYNNLILDSSYNDKLCVSQANRNIMLKEIKDSNGDIQKYTFLLDGIEYTIDSNKTKVSWETSTAIEDNKFTINEVEWTIQNAMIVLSNKSPVVDFEISSKTIETGTAKFAFAGQEISGSYSYKTVWDFKMNPNLDSHTIMGNYDPENPSELLNYYYLEAGKEYKIVETFGITKYFGDEFTADISSLDFVDVEGNYNNETNVGKCAQVVAGGQSINVLGAPEGGMNFRIKFKPYASADDNIIGITILPSIEINVNYQKETIYDGDDSNTYGLIQGGTTEYTLIENSRGIDFSIERNGVTADITKNDYTLEIVTEYTDASLGARVEQELTSAKLIIDNPPTLNAKRVVIKISDSYGYVEYLRYVVAAKTQVVISTNNITFTTGDKIEWDKDNQFPISFKKPNEETIQLASFYEAKITGATGENTFDNYGTDSSLKIDASGNLYGVQLNSVITKLIDDEGSQSKKFIPYVKTTKEGVETIQPISYDVYKLAEKNGNVLKSFDKYNKIWIYKGGSEGPDFTWEKGETKPADWPLDDKGALSPIMNESQYKIELYSSSSSAADGTIEFTLLKVTETNNLYYASRTNATDCYTFDYEIKIDGESDSIVDTNDGETIKNVGNAQYGSEKSLNTTLSIKVYDENKKLIDTVDVAILLKFGIYPEVQQQVGGLTSYDYVGLGDKYIDVLNRKSSSIILKSGQDVVGESTKQYSTVLGKTPTTSLSGTASKMGSGTLTSYDYDSSTRVLSLKKALNNDNKAEINNILYTYGSTNNTLTIGYRKVTLTDDKFEDDVTGITYQVHDNTLYVSKKVDNAGKVTINNIQYTVAPDGTVSYETLYESIFVEWKYESQTYWAQWNYKVVDKYNQVTTDDPLEAQDGNIKVKLDWVNGDYRFNPNTLELLKKDETEPLGTAKWVSDASGNRYEIVIGDATYKIVVEGEKMKFQSTTDKTKYYPDDSNSENALALTEETTVNSSWADKIKLTGLDGQTTSLKNAINVVVSGDNSDITNNTITNNNGLAGTTYSLKIVYKKCINGDVELKYNGNDIKVTFEHFSATSA